MILNLSSGHLVSANAILVWQFTVENGDYYLPAIIC